jgi:predicted  nucleic acid-binding Zn-ribbon protein
MPLIECSCGMMMSVSAAEPRSCCIRCGGVEFRLVEKWQAARSTATPFVPRASFSDCAPSRREVVTSGLAVAESMGEGAYI